MSGSDEWVTKYAELKQEIDNFGAHVWFTALEIQVAKTKLHDWGDAFKSLELYKDQLNWLRDDCEADLEDLKAKAAELSRMVEAQEAGQNGEIKDL